LGEVGDRGRPWATVDEEADAEAEADAAAGWESDRSARAGSLGGIRVVCVYSCIFRGE
jgi:hypothetical protein